MATVSYSTFGCCVLVSLDSSPFLSGEALLRNQVTVNGPKTKRPHSHLVKHQGNDVIAGRTGPQELKSGENLLEIVELVILHGND